MGGGRRIKRSGGEREERARGIWKKDGEREGRKGGKEDKKERRGRKRKAGGKRERILEKDGDREGQKGGRGGEEGKG